MILTAALAVAAACVVPAPVALHSDPQLIDRNVHVLFDPQRSFALSQVTSPPLCREFEPIRSPPELGYERRGIWLQWRLPALAPGGPWRLRVPFMGAQRLCVHWPLAAGGYRSECGGMDAAAGPALRTPQGWFASLPQDLDAQRPVLLYLHAPGGRLVEVVMELGTADGFVRAQHVRQTWFGALYGVLLGVTLFGMTLFAVQRDRMYLYFSLCLAALAIYVALRENHLAAWGLGGWAAVWLVTPMVGLFVACATPFLQRFLDSRLHTPWVHRGLTATAALTIAAAIALPFLLPLLGPLLYISMFLAWMVLVVALAVQRLRQGYRPVLYGIVAWLCLVLGGFLRAFEATGHPVLDAQKAKLFFYVGLPVAAAFLVMALVSRLRQLAAERDRANEEALSSQRLALHRAQYDALTRLPNRGKFRDELQERIARADGGDAPLAVITIGLDHFSAINHALGYKTGDGVLSEMAGRMERALAPGDLLGRTGSDVFAWMTPVPAGDAGRQSVMARAEALRHALASPLELGEGARLNASMGIAWYPEHAATAEGLLQCSDTAVHRAKALGGATLQIFEQELHRNADRYLALKKDLHRALERGGLALHYQPIVALADGSLLGVEALARWQRDDGRQVMPEQFIPIAEAGDLLLPFTEWEIRTACQQMRDWQARAVAVPYVSINLSAAQLRLPRIAERLLCEFENLPGTHLQVEITEGALLENLAATREILERLMEHGVSIAVDDFGVGYSSLNYLRSLPVDTLKIDRAFLRDVPADASATSVLAGIITLAQSLKLRIIPEGIESRAQCAYLAAGGVAAGQGFLFSRALPASELESWLQLRPAA